MLNQCCPLAGPGRIRNFQSQDFRDGILQNPGIFRDGISPKFYPGILPKKYGISRHYRTRVWSLAMLVTHSLPRSYCCLLNLINVTLACEDANSILVEVVNAEIHNDNSLAQIWKLKFGHKAKFLSRLVQHKVWSNFEAEVQVRFKLKFRQYFATDLWFGLRSWILEEILKLSLVKIVKFKYSRDADVWLRLWS